MRADRVVDLRDERAYRRALSDVAVVVNASGTEDPSLVEIAARRGVAFVDITATMDYIRAVEALDPPAPVLLSVGLAPGLTNLLAAAVHVRAPGPIDIALLLGSGERHGAAGTDWAYHLLGRQFTDTATSRPIRNYTQSRVFQLPGGGSRRLYRADYSDQHVLTRDLKAPVRTYFGLDSRIATLALALMTWVPTASPSSATTPRTRNRPLDCTRSRFRWHDPMGRGRRSVSGHRHNDGQRCSTRRRPLARSAPPPRGHGSRRHTARRWDPYRTGRPRCLITRPDPGT